MPDNRHVFLNNEKSDNPKFKRQRGRDNTKREDQLEENQRKIIDERQKRKLRANIISFHAKRDTRNGNREIIFSRTIDLIRISFFKTFNFDLQKKFEQRYGLSSVSFSDFNKTVIFEILDHNLFKTFEYHINLVIREMGESVYEFQPFNLIALIMHFEFIGTEDRLQQISEKGNLLTFVSSANIVYGEQRKKLISYLEIQNIPFTENEISPDILVIHEITGEGNKFIADNFDIVRMITSTRALKIRPGQYGQVRREYGFSLNNFDGLTTVGIIDTGINKIDPIANFVLNNHFDHSGKGAFWDEAGHGTMVAGLVIIGDEFQKNIRDNYNAKAKVLVIKALHFGDDEINLPNLFRDIREAKRRHGVRIFNMSLNIPGSKMYNDTYSQFAYELDKLAYQEDILIFISVGNFSEDSLDDLINIDPHPDHDYPTFYYNLQGTSSIHKCGNTNISEPAESLNNISVGALAGNLEEGDNSDVTPNNLSPAYYTRKFHLDYEQLINGHLLRKNQRNKYLNKPDLVFDGGDLYNYEAGIEILRSPLSDSEKYFGRSCGTSIATPLITSYAAEILNNYPKLKTQSVKALLINSAIPLEESDLPDFQHRKDVLLKNLTGFGKPLKDRLLSSDDNSITFIVEDAIKAGEILKVPIILPEYLRDSGNKLRFEISLCYSFLPVRDNHLNYLPLHISFNLVKNLSIIDVAEKDQKIYGIKSGFSWSEDHHGIENRLFSNTQSKSYVLQPNDLDKLGDSIALGVRCLVKEEISPSHLADLKAMEHPFSIAMRITELPEHKAGNQLYSMMIACNNVLAIVEAEGDATIDIDVEN